MPTLGKADVWMGADVAGLMSSLGTDSLEGLTPKSFPVVLNDIPSVVTQVTLPLGTRQIWLWTTTERVWYALDTMPGPVAPPTQGGVLPASSFANGAILMPNQWQALVMDAAMPHTLGLVSEGMSPTVYLTVWMETL